MCEEESGDRKQHTSAEVGVLVKQPAHKGNVAPQWAAEVNEQ